MHALMAHRRVAVRGPHGLGKTCLAAWLVIWGVMTADDVKVPTTASAWRQLTKYLWPEIHKWAGRLKWGRNGLPAQGFTRYQLLSLSIKLGATREAFALASDNPANIEGAHARRIVYVFDEAKEIPEGTWDAAEGAFSTAGGDTGDEAYALAISTPGAPQGRFYDIHRRASGFDDWWVRHVTVDEAIAAGRLSAEWVTRRRAQWGEGSAVFQNRVLGEFASSDEDSVIPLAWIEAANLRWHDLNDSGAWGEFVAQGVDVGRGGDPTVQALRFGNAVKELRRDSHKDTMHVVGLVKGVLDARAGIAVVDVIGIGAGVVDRLREQGYTPRVVAFNAAERTDRRDATGEFGFVNKRSAMWWAMREMLDPAAGVDVALPPDDKLTGDLTAPRWRVMSGGKIQVESKDDVHKRLGRSTDDADACLQAFWGRPAAPLRVSDDPAGSRWAEARIGRESDTEGNRWQI